MSTKTTNFELVKPDLTDAADITATNPNWDLIDEKLASLEDFANGNYADKSVTIHTTLFAENWEDNAYKWENENILSKDQVIELIPRATITSDQLSALQYANIVGTSQTVGSITLTAYGELPTMDIPVTFIIRGDV